MFHHSILIVLVVPCDDTLHKIGGIYASYTHFVFTTAESRVKIWLVRLIYAAPNPHLPSYFGCCPFQSSGSVVVYSLLIVAPIICEALPGGYLFPCSPEINWLVPLFPKNRKFVFLSSLFPNIVFVPLFPSYFDLCSPVPLK